LASWAILFSSEFIRLMASPNSVSPSFSCYRPYRITRPSFDRWSSLFSEGLNWILLSDEFDILPVLCICEVFLNLPNDIVFYWRSLRLREPSENRSPMLFRFFLLTLTLKMRLASDKTTEGSFGLNTLWSTLSGLLLVGSVIFWAGGYCFSTDTGIIVKFISGAMFNDLYFISRFFLAGVTLFDPLLSLFWEYSFD